ncbi:MAG: hypothetical protein U5K71_04865 [Gracilimonas sp.]|nr:hypothetical protein [Gracilimonas sp.]
MSDFRIEKDSMGEIKVPKDALYGAQTQRAHDNFPVSGIKFSREFIEALGYVKKSAAAVNADLGLLDKGVFLKLFRLLPRKSLRVFMTRNL